jgi:hypothetical protein
LGRLKDNRSPGGGARNSSVALASARKTQFEESDWVVLKTTAAPEGAPTTALWLQRVREKTQSEESDWVVLKTTAAPEGRNMIARGGSPGKSRRRRSESGGTTHVLSHRLGRRSLKIENYASHSDC